MMWLVTARDTPPAAPGLSFQLIDIGVCRASREWRVSPVTVMTKLLSRLCLTAQPYAPLSALPGRKRDHPDDDETDVGVDAVLSADVDDARYANASIPRRSMHLLRSRRMQSEQHTRDRSRRVGLPSTAPSDDWIDTPT